IWREMYSQQSGILTFPPALADKLDKLAFGALIDDTSRNDYKNPNVYDRSYEQMATLVQPTEYANGWRAILQPVQWKPGVLPSDEDVWLSLEDLCLRRELLLIFKEGNETSARMKLDDKAKVEPPSKLGEKFSRRFVNNLYQIDLVLNEQGRGKY